MTKPSSHHGGGDGGGLVAVERRVKAQVRDLRDVAALLRDVALVHEKYAQEHRKVAQTAPPRVATATPLQRVVERLEQAVTDIAQAHATLATELATTVAAPLEAFEKQQRHQTKQLVLEIDGAVQRERQLNHTLTLLVDKCASLKDPSALLSDEDNQSPEASAKTDVDEKASLVERIKELKEKRDSERNTIKKRLEELDLTSEQQTAIVDAQLRRCLHVFTQHASRVQSEISEALLPAAALTSDPGTTRLDDAVVVYDLHIDVTQWMNSIFMQLIPIEEAMLKRFQTMFKTHSLGTISKIFDPSSFLSPTDSERTTRWDPTQSHKQRMANLSDPIVRTLRFSKQKLETIRKELLESLDEAQKLVQVGRSKVKEKENKLTQLIQHEQRQEQPQQVLGTTGVETMMASGLTTFGLRSAVVSWTKQLSSPKKPLLKSKSASSVGFIVSSGNPPKESAASAPVPVASCALSPRQIMLRKDLSDARLNLQKLVAKEATQRDETILTLRSTALIGVKTMELMVNDYLKNISKAMALTSVAASKWEQRSVTKDPMRGSSSDAFLNILVFNTNDFSDDAIAKLLSNEKSVTPENNISETESDDPDCTGTDLVGLVCSQGPSDEVPRSRSLSFAIEAQKLRTQLFANDDFNKATATARDALEVGLDRVSNVLERLANTPETWTCIVTFMVIFSLLIVVRRLGQLDEGWRELTLLQEENAKNLEQIIELVGR